MSKNARAHNVAPSLSIIISEIEPVMAGVQITASSSFTDPGTLDSRTAIWSWGDETTSTTAVSQGTLSETHTNSTPGVYTITLTLTDDNGDSDTEIYEYVVVYDPEGGFVTGGGWIDSPTGAYQPNPTLTGKANFGFVSKYQKGANIPVGNTVFKFKVADFEFYSDQYDWLVIAGDRAKFKGTGTVNGIEGFKFILTATDGDPKNQDDLYRIKIWDSVTEEVVYDNKLGSGDDSYDGTVLGRGEIRVHKAK